MEVGQLQQASLMAYRVLPICTQSHWADVTSPAHRGSLCPRDLESPGPPDSKH